MLPQRLLRQLSLQHPTRRHLRNPVAKLAPLWVFPRRSIGIGHHDDVAAVVLLFCAWAGNGDDGCGLRVGRGELVSEQDFFVGGGVEDLKAAGGCKIVED